MQTWTAAGEGVEHQQVGNAWSHSEREEIVSLSFNGDLNVYDKRTGDKPVNVLYGRELLLALETGREPRLQTWFADQKSITTMSQKLSSSPTFFSGSYDGKVHSFNLSSESGVCKPVEGNGHSNAVVAIAASDRSKVFTAGMDDTIREIDGASASFSYVGSPSCRMHYS